MESGEEEELQADHREYGCLLFGVILDLKDGSPSLFGPVNMVAYAGNVARVVCMWCSRNHTVTAGPDSRDLRSYRRSMDSTSLDDTSFRSNTKDPAMKNPNSTSPCHRSRVDCSRFSNSPSHDSFRGSKTCGVYK